MAPKTDSNKATKKRRRRPKRPVTTTPPSTTVNDADTPNTSRSDREALAAVASLPESTVALAASHVLSREEEVEIEKRATKAAAKSMVAGALANVLATSAINGAVPPPKLMEMDRSEPLW